MKKITKTASASPSERSAYSPPDLKLIRGGAGDGQDGTETRTDSVALREALVERARSRVRSGYYERPEVRRQLVDVLWDEFYAR